MRGKLSESQDYIEGDVNLQQLWIGQQIGKSNSIVFEGNLNKQKVAIKKTEIKSNYEQQIFYNQIDIHRKLSAKSSLVIKYEGYLITERKKSSAKQKYGYLIMEYASSNLEQYLKQMRFTFSLNPQNIISISINLLAIFAFLENNNIAHCDIKPQNLLITNKNKLEIKICDVGSSKLIQNDKGATIRGTISFLAPQLIRIEQIKIVSINPFRSDVFSFGLVLLYIITGYKFTSKERRAVKENVYIEIISEWIKQAQQKLAEPGPVIEVLKKSVQMDIMKRPLFKQLKVLSDSLCRQQRILRDNKIKKYEKNEKNQISSKVRLDSQMGDKKTKTKFPLIKQSISSTLLSFNSHRRLTKKMNQNNQLSNSKKKQSMSKRNNSKSKGKQNEKSLNPKTTMHTTFSVDKSKVSQKYFDQVSKIVYITQDNFGLLNYENFNQKQKIFVLFYPHIQFTCIDSLVITPQCDSSIFGKLSFLKHSKNLYLQYRGVEAFGIDEDVSTLESVDNVFIDLSNSVLQSGYNNLLRCLCPISLKSISLNLSQSDITYQQVKSEIERLRNKQITKFDFIWNKCFLKSEQFVQMNEKISKLKAKKIYIETQESFVKTNENSRWPLPNCKYLYLNMSNNFLSGSIGSLSMSLIKQQLKELFINFNNNNLQQTDMKLLVKSISQIASLQKLILTLSENEIKNPNYCFQTLNRLSNLSSMQLKIHKCLINLSDFFSIFRLLLGLFHQSLKILKISIDRSVTKNAISKQIDQLIKQQFGEPMPFKIDIIGYNCQYFMLYLKKKNVPNIQNKQSHHKFRVRDTTLNSNRQHQSNQTFVGFIPNHKITNNSLINQSYTVQNYNSNKFSTSFNHNSEDNGKICNKINSTKSKNQKNLTLIDKFCQATISTFATYQCYICIGCSQVNQFSKSQYFCRSCIQSCFHKGHNIVRTYERRTCCCPYSYKCCFRQEQNQLVCLDRIGITYKKLYQCQICKESKVSCQNCIAECLESHPEYVIQKGSIKFRCHGSSQIKKKQ